MNINAMTLLLLGFDLMAGTVIGFFLRKKLVDGNQANIKDQGRQLIENALHDAKKSKKEILLQAKDQAYQVKLDADREVKQGRQELKDEQLRLDKKLDKVQGEFAALDKRSTKLQLHDDKITAREQQVSERAKDLESLIDEQRYKLEKIAGIGREAAKKELMASIESEARMDAAKRLSRIENEMKIEADRKGKNILALAISRYAGDYVADKTVSMVPLPNDEMKGRIIGREGRNIRAIEAATGIDIIIDDTPEAVILSGFNPIRREIARLALIQLISDGRIHPARIEEVVYRCSLTKF